MKRLFLQVCLLLYVNYCYCQSQDSTFNFFEGQWEWYWTSIGGAAGGHITPEDSGFTITIEFKALHSDSVNFYLYKNDTLIWDNVTTIFPVDTIALWAINKNVIPVLKKYFYIFTPIEYLDYLGLLIEDNDHITFLEPSSPEGPRHYFERIIRNTVMRIDKEHLINIFPNPFTDKITLVLGFTGSEEFKISIFNYYGHKFYEEIVHCPSEYYIHEIDYLDSFPSGIYFVRIVIGKDIYIEKILRL